MLLTVHCLLIYSNQTGVPAYACGILLYVRLFVYSCFGFFVCLLWVFFFFFVSCLFVSSWRTIFSFIAYVVNLVPISGSLLLGFSPGSCCRNLPFAFLLVSVPRPALAHNGAVECVFAPAAST